MPWDPVKRRWVELKVADPVAEIPATRCRKCTTPIKFVPVEFSRRMKNQHPIDAEPTPAGSLYQIESGLFMIVRGAALKRVLAGYGFEFYTSHFDTCPAAKSFRSKR